MTSPRVSLRLPTPVQDVLLALFVTVMGIQGTVTRATAGELVWRPLTEFGNLGYVLLVVGGVAVAGRRRWPVPVFALTALVSLVYYGLGFPDGPGWLGLFVALYTLAAYGDGRRSLLVAGVGTAVLAVGWLVAAADIQPAAAIGWVFFRIGASLMSTALGESIRSRRVIAAEAQERAELAERTREEEARARVDAERLRIAREVHDTVAHAIAIINVQSGSPRTCSTSARSRYGTRCTSSSGPARRHCARCARSSVSCAATTTVVRRPPGSTASTSSPHRPPTPASTSKSMRSRHRRRCPVPSTSPPTGSCRSRSPT
jgi:hypothetical protein